MINDIKRKIYKLLRKSEKWTQTDMVYLAKGSFWLSSSKTIGAITSIILAYFYANYLTKTDYATYKYIISIGSILSISTLLGMNTAITRAVILGYEGSIKLGRKIKLKYGIFGLLAGLVISSYYFVQENYILALGILIASIATPLRRFFLHGSYLQGKKKFDTTSKYNIIKSLFSTLFLVLILLFTKSIVFLITTLYLCNFTFSLIFSIITFKKYKINTKTDAESISYGKHLSLMNLLGVVSNNIDKIILWQLLGPVELAIYSFAIMPIEQIRNMLGQFTTLALPKLTEQDNTIIKKTLPKKVLKLAILILLLIILYILFSPLIFNLLFKEYTGSVYYSQIFSISLLSFPFTLFGSTLVAKAKKKQLYFVKLVIPTIKIFLLLLLIPIFGIFGAIYSILISQLINLLIVSFLFKKI